MARKISTLEGARRILGDGKVDSIIAEAIEAQRPSREPDGTRVIETDWAYSDAKWLEERLSRALAGGCMYAYKGNERLYVPSCEPEDWRELVENEDPAIRDKVSEVSIFDYEDIMDYAMPYIEQENAAEQHLKELDVIESMVYDIERDLETAIEDKMADEGAFAEAPAVELPRSPMERHIRETCNVKFSTDMEAHLGECEVLLNLGMQEQERYSSAPAHASQAFRDFIEPNMATGKPVGDPAARQALSESRLTWLLSTQGYTWADYVEQKAAARSGGKWESRFLESVDAELAAEAAAPASPGREPAMALTFCMRGRFEDMRKLMAGVTDIELGNSPHWWGKPMCGLFDPVGGGSGARMGIVLEKPLVISVGDIGTVDAELSYARHGTTTSVGEYFKTPHVEWEACAAPYPAGELREGPTEDYGRLNAAVAAYAAAGARREGDGRDAAVRGRESARSAFDRVRGGHKEMRANLGQTGSRRHGGR